MSLHSAAVMGMVSYYLNISVAAMLQTWWLDAHVLLRMYAPATEEGSPYAKGIPSGAAVPR